MQPSSNPTTNSNFTALTNPNFRVDSQGRDISTNSLLENPYMQYANPNRQNNSNAINSSSNEYVSPYEKLNGNNGSINGIFKFGQSYNKNVFGKRTFPSFYNQ